MALIIRLLILSIIDYLAIQSYVKQLDPDPSISMAVVFFVPLVIIINLFIAVILFFIKKQLVILFLINSIISAILMNLLFTYSIREHQQRKFENWTFKENNRFFEITHSKLAHTFSMSERLESSSSIEFLEGDFITKGKDYYLITDSTKYIIKNGFLYGFRNKDSVIKLSEIQ